MEKIRAIGWVCLLWATLGFSLTALGASAEVDLCGQSIQPSPAPLTLKIGARYKRTIDGLSQSSDGIFFDVWTGTATPLAPMSIEILGKGGDPDPEVSDDKGIPLSRRIQQIGSPSHRTVNFLVPDNGSFRVSVRSSVRCRKLNYEIMLRALKSPTTSENRTFVMLVGISNTVTGGASMTSAMRDLELMHSLFRDTFKVPEADIRILPDATLQEFVEEFVTHLGRAGPRGSAVLYFTGHGTKLGENIHLTGEQDNEKDGTDQVLVLRDGGLLDDHLGILIDQLRAGNKLVILDSCFSGDGTRADVPDGTPELREKATPFELLLESGFRVLGTGIQHSMNQWFALRGSKKPVERPFNADSGRNLPYVVLSASAKNMPALYISDPTGQSPSIFTKFLAESLPRVLSNQPQITFQSAMRVISKEVESFAAKSDRAASPQYEGRRASEPIAPFIYGAR